MQIREKIKMLLLNIKNKRPQVIKDDVNALSSSIVIITSLATTPPASIATLN